MLLLHSAAAGQRTDDPRGPHLDDVGTGQAGPQWPGTKPAATELAGTELVEIVHTFVVPPQLAHTLVADLVALGFEVVSEQLLVRRRLTATVRVLPEPGCPEVSPATVAQLEGLARDSLGTYRGWQAHVVTGLGEAAAYEAAPSQR